MARVLRALLILCLALPAAARAHSPPAPTASAPAASAPAASAPAASAPAASASTVAAELAALRQRDRFGPPDAELAAWQAFAERIAADRATPAPVRAEARLGLAIARFHKQDYPGAEAALLGATDLAGPGLAGLPFAHELLAYRSLVASELGRPDAGSLARAALAQAVAFHGADSAAAALARNALGLRLFADGDYPAAGREMCEAARLARRHLPARDGMVTNNLSSCAAILFYADQEAAIPAFAEAAAFAFANLPANSTRLALVLNNSAGALGLLGRWSEVEDIARKAVDAYRRAMGPDVSDQVSPLSLLGKALLEQGRLDEAEAVLHETALLAERLPRASDPSRPGNAKLQLGLAHMRRGALDQAADWTRRGIADLEASVPGSADLGAALRQSADLAARRGALDQARAQVEQAVAILTREAGAGHRDTLAARLTLAAVRARQGEAAAALDQALPAGDALAARLADLAATRAERVSLAPTLRTGLAEIAYIALLADRPETALRFAQLALLSDLALADAQLAAAAGARDAGAGALLAEMRRLQQQTRQFETALANAASDPARLAVLAREQQDRALALGGLERQLAAQHPGVAALARPRAEPAAALRARLGQDEAMVWPLLLADRTVTLVADRRGLRWAETPMPRHLGLDLVARLAGSLDPRNLQPFDADAAHRLFAGLFAPRLWRQMARYRSLRFPAGSALAPVPPGVLLTRPPGVTGSGGEPVAEPAWLLAEKAVLIDAPGRAAGARRAAGGFLGIGAPEGTPLPSLPPLPGAARELAALDAALPGGGTVLTGPAASESGLRAQDLTRPAVLVLATHGLGPGDAPGLEEAALLLAGGGSGPAGDGLLTASEIAAMTIPVDWAVLSACDSAGGGRRRAERFTGLARAFRLAGARSLLLAHWQVRDDVSARVSVATLRAAAAGLPRAEALRRAQLAVMRDSAVPGGADPSVWAPFVLLGD